ncbi:uncharacterized protein M421DRAFT_143232 [Didymella exigua CBS 183.55]|uniref:Secreted protein n=1 Tax=Didymella exigua CBS 183.55 TaxID=1150837 RepID=A0A6A5RP64_9PLEO|nr:uncharacterized protein M421DRAFT_143232 [Didymella exigua CBS 183.55]KAF1928948.1 hypothetical protein M421DRAFT_143232 [Didymella exigua CBS 183.55]
MLLTVLMCSSLLPLPSSATGSSFNALACTPLPGLQLPAELLPHKGCMAKSISGSRASDPKDTVFLFKLGWQRCEHIAVGTPHLLRITSTLSRQFDMF